MGRETRPEVASENAMGAAEAFVSPKTTGVGQRRIPLVTVRSALLRSGVGTGGA